MRTAVIAAFTGVPMTAVPAEIGTWELHYYIAVGMEGAARPGR